MLCSMEPNRLDSMVHKTEDMVSWHTAWVKPILETYTNWTSTCLKQDQTCRNNMLWSLLLNIMMTQWNNTSWMVKSQQTLMSRNFKVEKMSSEIDLIPLKLNFTKLVVNLLRHLKLPLSHLQELLSPALQQALLPQVQLSLLLECNSP